MSKLYNIVSDIITSSSMDEAENKLFGTSGIRINSEEYFENIVSNFIRKKEYIIRKENNNLVFDLTNYNDIWNIIFLGEYIKGNDILYNEYNNLLDEIDTIKHSLEIIRNKHRGVHSREEHESINKEYRLLKVELDSKNELLDNYKNVVDTFNKIDWVKLEDTNDDVEKQDAAKLLKQCINLIHKLRNSFQHGKVDTGKQLEINDDNFHVSIPIEYLDGFNKGRIIANEEDRIIAEKTNLISSPLLEALGYDVKKVESFFYNVNPEYLSFLLDQVNYNYDELYKLKAIIFYKPAAVNLFYAFGYNLNFINTFPSQAFQYLQTTLDFLSEGIDIFKLPDTAFQYPEDTKSFLANGIDIYNLPDFVFRNNILPDEIKQLITTGININKIPRFAFFYPKVAIDLYKKGFDIYNLSDMAFEYPEAVIKLDGWGINIYNLPDEAFEHSEAVIELYEVGTDEYNLPGTTIDIYNLSGKAFEHPKSVIKMYEKGIDIYDLPDIAFEHSKSAIKLIENGLNISNLSDKAYYYPEVTIDLYKKGFDIYNLPEFAFRYSKSAIQLKKKGIDLFKLSLPTYNYSILTETYTIQESIFFNFQSIVQLYEKGIDIYKLPGKAFEHPKSVIKMYEKGINVYALPENAFGQSENVIRIYEEGINIYMLPEHCYQFILKMKNIKYLLSLVDNNYDKLTEFPIEFFTCDIELIEEMYKTYNLNITRSIFGINNPKLIATIIYCDSVFKKYQKENGDCNIVNFDSTTFIRLGYENTLNFKNNISDMEMDRKSYLDQFILDFDGNYRDQTSIKSNILDKLRNSICHFRFKPVKDSDGKIVEDKIYLYDKFENSNKNNFNMILDIQDLVSIARRIELDLSRDNNVDNKAHEENIIHRNRV